jgi:hypothetical protein
MTYQANQKSPDFAPVPLRRRHDGWSPDKQVEFIEALAASGCVDEACRSVGMGRTSAYALRARPDAIAFRLAWDAALDHAIRALTDAAFSRALHGVARPVFYKGEQIGERRYFDERLTMFLLRYRDPARYGAWLDRTIAQRPRDHEAQSLGEHIDRLALDAWADELGEPRPAEPYPSTATRLVSEQEWQAANTPKSRKSRGT